MILQVLQGRTGGVCEAQISQVCSMLLVMWECCVHYVTAITGELLAGIGRAEAYYSPDHQIASLASDRLST